MSFCVDTETKRGRARDREKEQCVALKSYAIVQCWRNRSTEINELSVDIVKSVRRHTAVQSLTEFRERTPYIVVSYDWSFDGHKAQSIGYGAINHPMRNAQWIIVVDMKSCHVFCAVHTQAGERASGFYLLFGVTFRANRFRPLCQSISSTSVWRTRSFLYNLRFFDYFFFPFHLHFVRKWRKRVVKLVNKNVVIRLKR